MKYQELVKRCRKTLDLYEDSDVDLRDMSKILARNYSNAQSVAALYACLWTNAVEYIEAQRDAASGEAISKEK